MERCNSEFFAVMVGASWHLLGLSFYVASHNHCRVHFSFSHNIYITFPLLGKSSLVGNQSLIFRLRKKRQIVNHYWTSWMRGGWQKQHQNLSLVSRKKAHKLEKKQAHKLKKTSSQVGEKRLISWKKKLTSWRRKKQVCKLEDKLSSCSTRQMWQLSPNMKLSITRSVTDRVRC